LAASSVFARFTGSGTFTRAYSTPSGTNYRYEFYPDPFEGEFELTTVSSSGTSRVWQYDYANDPCVSGSFYTPFIRVSISKTLGQCYFSSLTKFNGRTYCDNTISYPACTSVTVKLVARSVSGVLVGTISDLDFSASGEVTAVGDCPYGTGTAGSSTGNPSYTVEFSDYGW
jgi:hypothetical protein